MAPRRLDARAIAADTALGALLVARGIDARATVTIEHDGHRVEAREGEPLAVSLLAKGTLTLARSVKFHRPRGPSCLRGACEGCLTRIDGVPNVMACRVPAREGAVVESQNSFPSAKIDVLRVTDWFFPKQFDHHHLMVRYGRALNATMQVFARRMAGLGTLPEASGSVPAPEAHECDVLVVGAGPAGLAAAAELARSGATVLCLEEESEVGGTLADDLERLPGAGGAPGPTGREFAAALLSAARRAGATVMPSASAAATFDNATVVVAPDRALLVRARARVFANGCHESIGAFESNDLPGVFTARAAARALAQGVLIGDRVAVIGAAWPSRGLAAALAVAGAQVEWLPTARVEAARGSSAVAGVRVTEGGGRARNMKCDALVIAEDATPAYELLGQSGVGTRPEPARRCFAPEASGDGSTERADVFAAGSVRERMADFDAVDLAAPLEAGGAVADGLRVARTVSAYLRTAPAPSRAGQKKAVRP